MQFLVAKNNTFSFFLWRVQFRSVSANIRFQEVSSNFKKFSKDLKFSCQRNFIFRGFYKIEYFSNLHEKLTVRKVKFWTFRPVLQSFRRLSYRGRRAWRSRDLRCGSYSHHQCNWIMKFRGNAKSWFRKMRFKVLLSWGYWWDHTASKRIIWHYSAPNMIMEKRQFFAIIRWKLNPSNLEFFSNVHATNLWGDVRHSSVFHGESWSDRRSS